MWRVWRWITEVSIGGSIMLVGRWLLHMSRPADDVWAVRRFVERVTRRGRDYWSILWRAYGPVTADMRSAWERLRARYHDGAYGAEGT